jgi:hypothetical protein
MTKKHVQHIPVSCHEVGRGKKNGAKRNRRQWLNTLEGSALGFIEHGRPSVLRLPKGRYGWDLSTVVTAW